MKKVLLCAYDRQNLGDDLFVHTIVKRYPHVKFYMWSDPINRKTFQGLSNLKILNPKGKLMTFLHKVRPSLVVRYRYWREKKCKVMVYIGGSIFIEYEEWEHILNWWEYMAETRSFYVMGANFGPYQTEAYRQKISQIFGKMQDICLRDQFSYELFKGEQTVRYAPDILFSYPMPKAQVINKQVFVSVIDCVGRGGAGALDAHDENYVKNMANLLREYLNDGYTLVLSSFCKEEGDERGIEKVVRAMGCENDSRVQMLCYDGTNAEEVVTAIASSEYVIATRFHAMVLAMTAGRPVLPIIYSDKTGNVLKDLGFQGRQFDLRKDQTWPYADSRYNLEQKEPKLPEALKENAQDHFMKLDEVLGQECVPNVSHSRTGQLKRVIHTVRTLLSGKTKHQLEMESLLSRGLKMGKNSTVCPECRIDSGWPWLITIGDDVTIAPNVTILAHDASTNVVQYGTKLGRVTIGNNVFVGTNSTILCNTRIGDNVVIGAGSLVTKDLPSNGVYVGVPAVKVATIEEYRKKNEQLRAERPHLDEIRPWYDWHNATNEEKELMKKKLEDGIGFI